VLLSDAARAAFHAVNLRVAPPCDAIDAEHSHGRGLPMSVLQIAIKVLISAGVIVAVSELAKRSGLLGAALASLPLTSLLAFVWLYLETGDIELVAKLSTDIFWLVIPSLLLFVVLPVMLRAGMGFWLSLLAASAASIIGYGLMGWLLTVYTGRASA
jgi:hypothetical protein